MRKNQFRVRAVIAAITVLMLLLAGCTGGPISPQNSGPGSNTGETGGGGDSETGNSNSGTATGNTTGGTSDVTTENNPSGQDETSGGGGTNSADPQQAAEPIDAVWMAVGDIMMHMPQLPGAYDSKQKRYVFNPFFEKVKPVLEQSDWTIANLETPIAGKALGYSGFPRFNAPTELAEALKYTGFDIITTANNHALDRGAEGIKRTLEALDKQGLTFKGTARSKTEAEKLTIVEEKGIRMGLLAYTYGTNGIALPNKQPYAVSLIDEKAIVGDIGRLRAAGADFVTVALHFGTEYQTTPNETQKALARKLVAAGADIIAGAHPHVVQPYELVDVREPDGTTRRGLIIYSMGNFISNQRGGTKDYGVIMKVDIRKDPAAGKTVIGDVEAIPTWVYRYKANGKYQYRVIPVEENIEARSIKGLKSSDYSRLKRDLATLTKRLGSMASVPVNVEAEQ